MKIKVIISILLISSFSLSLADEDNKGYVIDEILDVAIEQLKEMMKNGDPEHNIPVLDPYEFEFVHAELPGDIFSLTANFTNGIVSGASGFELQQFNFSVEQLGLEFEIYFPSLTFTSEYYEMDGNIKEAVPLAGKGIMHVEVYDFKLRSEIYLKPTEDGKSLLIDRFEKPKFSVGRIVTNIAFDDNIDNIANAMIKDLLADYLNRFNGYLAATISDPIVNSLNSVLEKLTPKE